MKNYNFFVYITTNPSKSTLYIGVTKDLPTRLAQHYGKRGIKENFAGKYYCYNLIYWERYQFVEHAIEREKELKKWRRAKKEKLIESYNPEWKTLNDIVAE